MENVNNFAGAAGADRSDKQLFTNNQTINDQLNKGIKAGGKIFGPDQSSVLGETAQRVATEQFADFVTGHGNFEGFSQNFQEGGFRQALGGVADKVSASLASGEAQSYLGQKLSNSAHDNVSGQLIDQAGLNDTQKAAALTLREGVKDRFNQEHFGTEPQHETPEDVRDTFSNIFTNIEAANTFSNNGENPSIGKLGVLTAVALRNASDS